MSARVSWSTSRAFGTMSLWRVEGAPISANAYNNKKRRWMKTKQSLQPRRLGTGLRSRRREVGALVPAFSCSL